MGAGAVTGEQGAFARGSFATSEGPWRRLTVSYSVKAGLFI